MIPFLIIGMYLNVTPDGHSPCGIEGCTICGDGESGAPEGILFFLGCIAMSFVFMAIFFPRAGKD
jgi:hypothetical protein